MSASLSLSKSYSKSEGVKLLHLTTAVSYIAGAGHQKALIPLIVLGYLREEVISSIREGFGSAPVTSQLTHRESRG